MQITVVVEQDWTMLLYQEKYGNFREKQQKFRNGYTTIFFKF